MECIHCKLIFTNSSNLKYHQRHTKNCLTIQSNLKQQIIMNEYETKLKEKVEDDAFSIEIEKYKIDTQYKYQYQQDTCIRAEQLFKDGLLTFDQLLSIINYK
jgi:hypothetical protein